MRNAFLSNLWPVACQANLELSKARAGAEETSRKLSEQAPRLHMTVIWRFLAMTRAVESTGESSLEMNKWLWTCEEQPFLFDQAALRMVPVTLVCAQVNHQTEELNKLVVTFVILKTKLDFFPEYGCKCLG